MAGILALLGGLACADGPSWVPVMAEATVLTQTQRQDAMRRLDRLSKDQQARANDLLTAMADAPATATGLTRAAEQLKQALPGFADPNSAVTGADPAQAAVAAAALCLFQGMAVRAGKAAAAGADPADDALALLRAVRTLPAFDDASRAQIREELRAGLGAALYVGALKAEAAAGG